MRVNIYLNCACFFMVFLDRLWKYVILYTFLYQAVKGSHASEDRNADALRIEMIK